MRRRESRRWRALLVPGWTEALHSPDLLSIRRGAVDREECHSPARTVTRSRVGRSRPRAVAVAGSRWAVVPGSRSLAGLDSRSRAAADSPAVVVADSRSVAGPGSRAVAARGCPGPLAALPHSGEGFCDIASLLGGLARSDPAARGGSLRAAVVRRESRRDGLRRLASPAGIAVPSSADGRRIDDTSNRCAPRVGHGRSTRCAGGLDRLRGGGRPFVHHRRDGCGLARHGGGAMRGRPRGPPGRPRDPGDGGRREEVVCRRGSSVVAFTRRPSEGSRHPPPRARHPRTVPPWRPPWPRMGSSSWHARSAT